MQEEVDQMLTQQEAREGSCTGSVAADMNNESAANTELICPPKDPSHETVHRHIVSPGDVGADGFVDGGTLLEWIDKAAHAAAAQWCGGHCVAASVGNLHLDRPIGVGELVDVHASLVYTGRSTMHILVTVCSSDPTRATADQSS